MEKHYEISTESMYLKPGQRYALVEVLDSKVPGVKSTKRITGFRSYERAREAWHYLEGNTSTIPRSLMWLD